MRIVRSCFRSAIWVGVFAVILAQASPVRAQESGEPQTANAINSVARSVKESLVRIRVVSAEYDQGKEIKEEAFGSGVIISKQGHVITNHHVAGHATQVTCTLADKTELDAELVGTDALSDISVLKLIERGKREFPVAKFGNSSKVRTGDRVLAIGSPLAFSQSVTMGIVSNTELVMPEVMRWAQVEMDGEDVGSIVLWIAHDAQIYGGNSGGALVNMRGEVVGINEIRLGLAGAIPSNLAREVAEQIIKNGKVRRSWAGFTTQKLLKSSGLNKGVLISYIIDGSPAEKAGFHPGDVLLNIGGHDCTVRFSEELPFFNRLVCGFPAGEEIKAVVLRDGKETTLKLTPVDREEAKARPREFKQWGISASNVSLLTAKKMKRADSRGALVTGVRPGGPCGEAKPAIEEDDVIVQVAGKPIANVEDLRRATAEITDGKKEPVPTVVAFDRDDEKYLTVVKVGYRELNDPGLEVRKAWLPVGTQVLTREIAEALGAKGRKGVRVTQVYPNTEAEKAGLKVGDVIVALDGTEIRASEPEDTEVLPAMVRQYKIGSSVELTVLRDGEERKLAVILPQAVKLPREMKKYRDENFEITVRDIAFMDRVEAKLPETQLGVLVESISEGGWASLGRLSIGDLIVSLNGVSVQDVAAFRNLMEEVSTKKPKAVVFRVNNGLRSRYIEIEPSWASDSKPARSENTEQRRG